MFRFKVEKRWYFFMSIILVEFVAYIVPITYSGLWYDEAIEYFYSKVLFGEVPGGFGKLNMYERICNTYQPPLYNVFMYIWLSLFDSEMGFRLAGVLLTLISSAGIFMSLEELGRDSKWSSLGTLVYIFTSSVAYYALECSEYNLMLCCVSWTVYFYIRLIKRRNTSALIGFLVFSCMSVYSQYGALFIVVGMFLYVVSFFIKIKDRDMLKKITVGTMLVFFIAALPLIYFFLLPQMAGQGSISVSHDPVFINNILKDFYQGIVTVLSWLFTFRSLPEYSVHIWNIIKIMFLITVVLVFIKRELFQLVLPLAIAYLFYFIAVACSFYGYNDWAGTLGCHNFGGRYALFFIPIIVVVMIISMKNAVELVKEKFISNALFAVFAAIVIVFCGMEVIQLDYYNWKKDDIREIVDVYYENEAYHIPVLVHEWSDANFQFYLLHHEGYRELYQNNIITADIWIRDAEYDEMEQKLDELGIFSVEEFYYICPASGSYQIFMEVLNSHGFIIEKLFEGRSALLYVRR